LRAAEHERVIDLLIWSLHAVRQPIEDVLGLAGIYAVQVVGERLVGTRPLGRWIFSAAAGALIFRLVLALAVRAGLNPNALKLVTALFVLAVLVLPELAQRTRRATGRRVPHRA
jgi:putative ABC transport system permease protein